MEERIRELENRLAEARLALQRYRDLDERRAQCEECGEIPELAAEACGECMPFADEARCAMRSFLDGKPIEPFPSDKDMYYVQDSRSYVGNDVSWWAKDGHGYTTDLTKAHVFTREELLSLDRDTDIAWPKAYVDERARPAVDMQLLEKARAITRERRKELRRG